MVATIRELEEGHACCCAFQKNESLAAYEKKERAWCHQPAIRIMAGHLPYLEIECNVVAGNGLGILMKPKLSMWQKLVVLNSF